MGEEHSDSGSEKSSVGSNSRSPSRSRSGSRSSRSRSKSNSRSGSGSRSNSRSKSGSHSRSVSHSRSRSHSKSGSHRSRSGSKRSRSGSKRSRSGSHRSRSGSNRSRSGSNKSRSPSNKSRSASPQKSRSGSPQKSRSNSPQKSKSRSPRKSGSESRESAEIGHKKRKILSDSDSEEGEKKETPQKRAKLIDTDSDEDDVVQNRSREIQSEEKEDGKNVNELFGDADDISSDEDGAGKSDKSNKSDESDKESVRKKRSGSEQSMRSRSRSRSRSRDSNEREERERSEEREPIPETRIDVEIPRILSDLGKDIHFVKLPNFLSVDTRPFDPETYEDEIDEEETLDEEGRQRLKLKVGNTIRWRKFINDKGETIQESNARFVRWSDGSLSLHLGSEIFDVYKQPLQNDYNHLFIRQGTGLQGQAVFRTKLTFRPHSTDSFTHKKMTMSLADRSQKTSGIKILSQVGQDPEQFRAENIKKEEESLRQVMRQRKPVKSSKRSAKRMPGATGSYENEENSEDESGISIAAIKNKYNKKGSVDNKPIYSSDEDDDASDGSDFDARKKKKDKSKPVKALKDSDDEGGSGKHSGSENDDDDKHSGSENSAKGSEASGGSDDD